MLEMLKERKEALEAQGKKGFTLMEMLIVIAIIAILIAIAIPIFTAQLENAREATDAANIRSAYAEVVAKALTDSNTDVTANVPAEQQQDNWTNSAIKGQKIGGIEIGDEDGKLKAKTSGNYVIAYKAANGDDANAGKITIDGTVAVTSFTS